MSYLDLAIIYLACGAPFGVYRALERTEQEPMRRFLSSSVAFLLWPGSVLVLLSGFAKTAKRDPTELHRRVEDFRVQMESLMFGGRSTSSLFDFREVFYRYTGLLEAVSTSPQVSQFEVQLDKRCSPLQTVCLARRNRIRLDWHLDRARSDFLELVGRSFGSRDIHEIASRLVDMLNDTQAVSSLATTRWNGDLIDSKPAASPSRGHREFAP